MSLWLAHDSCNVTCSEAVIGTASASPIAGTRKGDNGRSRCEKQFRVTVAIKVELERGGNFLFASCTVIESVFGANSGAVYIIAVIACFNGNGSLAAVPVETIS
jgi:hypothetical protein